MVESLLVWIDGVLVDDPTVNVLDWGLQRGDGCFEVFRSYDGAGFAIEDHLDRLAKSAQALELPLPSRDQMSAWALKAAQAGGECIVRILATRGSPTFGLDPSIVMIAEPVPEVPVGLRLMPVHAPWHSAGRPWGLAGVKSLSYAPNVAASRSAHTRGFDDALLLGEGWVLEGPTFTIGWVKDGVLVTPSLELLILDSITRRHALAAAHDLGIAIEEGRYSLDHLLAADEVFALSTIKEVVSVGSVGPAEFAPGPVAGLLFEAFTARRRSFEGAARDAS